MEVIRKNNYELIRSVNRAQTVTIAALNVAVTVAGALYNQKVLSNSHPVPGQEQFSGSVVLLNPA